MIPLPKMRPRDVDMSPEAIDQRLRDMSDMTKLCLALANAKRLGTVKEFRERELAAELAKQAEQSVPHVDEAANQPEEAP